MRNAGKSRWPVVASSLALTLGFVFVSTVGAQGVQTVAQPASQQAAATGQKKKKIFKKRPPLKKMTFNQWLQKMMKPRPYAKSVIVRIDKTHAYPCKACEEWTFTIVKEDKDHVWLQPLPPEDPKSPLHKFWLQEQIEEARLVMEEKSPNRMNLINFAKVIAPPPSEDALRFTVSSGDLPQSGQWRNNFAFADMNEDGKLDIVLPPPRKGPFRFPIIALGDGHGHFHQWKGLKWPNAVPFDYGGVAVGDFNKDGHQDIVMGIHFKGQYILYGNGKGDFSHFVKLPTPDPRLHSQAVAVADFNGDGWPDIAFLAEISYDLGTSNPLDKPTLWVLENLKGKGWKVRAHGLPVKIMGAQLVASDIDGNGRPDLIVSSSVNGWRWLVFLNEGNWTWKDNKPGNILAGSYHYSVVPEGSHPHSVVAAFQQFQTTPVANAGMKAHTDGRAGLVRYTFDRNGDVSWKILMMDATNRERDPYWRVASGDINGDGVADLVAVRKKGEIVVLLGDGHGGYTIERSPELKPVGHPFAVAIRDLNGDGRGDILLMSADEGKKKGGFEILTAHPNS
ncbi:MAG: VCBS repeat-containing protein [Acidobacteria bacterium]|nr:VCBS repeat-containing protein [Acidobacteriota bacterium]